MTAEQLNVKINLDLTSLKASIKQVKNNLSDMANGVKQSLPKISTEGKKASDSLDKVTNAGKSVKKIIQDIGDEAKTSLASVTTQSNNMKVALASAAASGTALGTSLGTNASDSVGVTTESLTKMQGTMQMILGMNFADLFIENWDKIKETFAGVKTPIVEFRKYKQELEKIRKVAEEIKINPLGSVEGDASNLQLKSLKTLADKQLKNVDAAQKKAFGNMLKSLKSAISAVAGLIAKFVALTMVVGAVVLAINAFKVSELGKQIYVAAAQVGMSTQKYQEWAYVFEKAGIEADELKEVIKTLTEAQVDVLDGTEDMITAFKKLGMSQEEVSGMSQQQLWENTITALQNVEDVTERTAIAYKIFSEDTAKLTTLLNLSNQETSQLISTYNELGATMSDRLVTRSNILQGSVTNLKNAWQGLKNTLAEAVLPVVIAVVNWVVKAVAILNMFFKTIFGISLTTTTATNSATTSIKKSTAAVGGYSGALNQATSAAEKLKRSVMGFDELNRLPGVDSGSGSAAGGAGGSPSAGISVPDMGADLSGMIDTDSLGLDKYREWFAKYKTLIQDITTWSLIGIGVIGAVLCFMGGNWLGGIAMLGMAGLGIAIGSVEGGTFERLGKKIQTWWDGIKAWFKQYVAPFFTKAFWLEKWNALVAATTEKIDAIKNAISTKWNAIKAWFKEAIGPIFTKAYWANKFDTIRTAINEKLEAVRTAISTKWTSIKNWFKDSVAPKFTKSYWTGKFDTVRSAVSDKVGAAVSVVQDKWNSLKKWFNTNIAPKFTTSYWKDKFSTIGSGAKSAFNSVISIVESAINGIIKKINTLSWKIPDWVPKFGGQKFGFNFKTISIPRLATGGIVTGSTLANIGERGAEAVLPLTGSQSTAWMDMLAGKIADRSAAGAPTKVVLMLDGKELGWATINNINAITKQTGGLQLAL